MKSYPEPTVGAFIFNKKEQLLLVQSYKWRGGLWHVPGGHIELGETIESAVKREVKEEVGLNVKNIKVFQIWEAIFPKEFSRRKHFLFLECRCETIDEKVVLDGDEIKTAQWFSIEEAGKLKLEVFTRKSINILKEHKNVQFNNDVRTFYSSLL